MVVGILFTSADEEEEEDEPQEFLLCDGSGWYVGGVGIQGK